MKYSLLIASLIIAGSGAQAQESTQQTAFDSRTVRGVIGMSYALGGKEIVKAEFDNGDTDSIKAGQGFELYVGALFRPKSVPYEFQASFGRLSDSIKGKNGKLELKRNVINLGGYYRINNKHRAGLGYSKHSSIKYTGRIDGGGSESVNFEDSNGIFAEWGYLVGVQGTMGIRLTKQTYKAKAPEGYIAKDLSANSIGFFANYNF